MTESKSFVKKRSRGRPPGSTNKAKTEALGILLKVDELLTEGKSMEAREVAILKLLIQQVIQRLEG